MPTTLSPRLNIPEGTIGDLTSTSIKTFYPAPIPVVDLDNREVTKMNIALKRSNIPTLNFKINWREKTHGII